MAIVRIFTLASLVVSLLPTESPAQFFKEGPFRRLFNKAEPEAPDAPKSPAKQDSSSQKNGSPKLPDYPRPTPRTGSSASTGLSEPPLQSPRYSPRNEPGYRIPTPAPQLKSQSQQAITNNGQLRIFGAVVQQRTGSGPLVITYVPETSDAYRAGLRQGDELVSVAGIEIEDLAAIEGLEGLLKPGDQVDAVVNRQRKKQKLELVYRAEEAAKQQLSADSSSLTLGKEDERRSHAEPDELHIVPRHQIRSLLGLAPTTKESLDTRSAVPTQPQSPNLPLLESIEELRNLVSEQQATIKRLEAELRKMRSSSTPVRRR